jgi:hypothetical protein
MNSLEQKIISGQRISREEALELDRWDHIARPSATRAGA